MRCPFCASEATHELKKLVSSINQKEYTLYHCSACDLQFFTPLEFEDIYSDDSLEGYQAFHEGRTIIPEWTKISIDYLKRFMPSLSEKAILDIGAGDGIQFIALQKAFGIESEQYYALELDEKSLATCKERGIRHTINQYFDKSFIQRTPKKFDIIICTEVLEHQVNPKEFLDTAMAVLADDGLLIITVPNRDRRFINHRSAAGDIPPHHFLRFNATFFTRNFKEQLLSCSPYVFKNKNVYESAGAMSTVVFKTKRLWFLFVPLVGALRVIDRLSGEGLIAVLKK